MFWSLDPSSRPEIMRPIHNFFQNFNDSEHIAVSAPKKTRDCSEIGFQSIETEIRWVQMTEHVAKFSVIWLSLLADADEARQGFLERISELFLATMGSRTSMFVHALLYNPKLLFRKQFRYPLLVSLIVICDYVQSVKWEIRVQASCILLSLKKEVLVLNASHDVLLLRGQLN